MGSEAIWIPLAVAAVTTAGTIAVSELTKPKVDVPGIGPKPEVPGLDNADMRARLAHQRDLASLRVDAAASPGVATGLQIPN